MTITLQGFTAGAAVIQAAQGTYTHSVPAVTDTGATWNNLGARNRFINGGFAIDQRNAGAAQTITAGAALAYTTDRWYAYCTGANVAGQRVAGSAGSAQYRYQFTGAASVTGISIGQRIETLNSYDLAGTTATLSVDISNSLLTTVTWTASYATTTADTFGTVSAPTVTQIATGTFTVSSTLTRYNVNIAIPAAAVTGLQVVFSVGAQISGTWVLGNAQFEAGSVATPFERRQYGQELALAQRYYESTAYPLVTFAITSVTMYISATTGTIGGTKFLMAKRATPTVQIYSRNNTAGAVSYVNSGADIAGTQTASNINPVGFWGVINGTANYVAGGGYEYGYTASAEL